MTIAEWITDNGHSLSEISNESFINPEQSFTKVFAPETHQYYCGMRRVIAFFNLGNTAARFNPALVIDDKTGAKAFVLSS